MTTHDWGTLAEDAVWPKPRPSLAPDVRDVIAADWECLAEAIRSRRCELGLSLAEVAKAADVGTRFIYDTEHAVPRPEYLALSQVASVLGLRLMMHPSKTRSPRDVHLEPYMSNEVPDDEQ